MRAVSRPGNQTNRRTSRYIQIDTKVVSATDNAVNTAEFSLVMLYLFKICPFGLGTQHEAEENPAATLYDKLELVGMNPMGVVPSCFGAGGLIKSNTYFE